MGARYWVGKRFGTRHEEAAVEELQRLVADHVDAGQSSIDFAISFDVPGAEIDLLALGPGRVIAGDLKQWPGTVRGKLNGPWTVTASGECAFTVGKLENPYQQCKRIRSRVAHALVNWSNSTGKRWDRVTGRPVLAKDWSRRIRSGVVQCPRKDAKLDKSLNEPWWYIEGLDTWLDHVFKLKTGTDGLSPNDAASFLTHLGLQRIAGYGTTQLDNDSSVEKIELVSAKEIDARRKEGQDEQKLAIRAPLQIHLRIEAGPGAGKTLVLQGRAQFLRESGVDAKDIALVTYTRSATLEMLNRLQTSGENRLEMPFVGTIHQFCGRILRENINAAGLTRPPRVLDSESAKRAFITSNNQLAPQEAGKLYVRIIRELNHSDGVDRKTQYSSSTWAKYEAWLKRRDAATFETLQTWALDIIQRKVGQVPKFILVDEYQDTTGLQLRLLQALASRGSWVTVVGDGEQSVFSFAGANPVLLSRFGSDFKPSQTRLLKHNWRSQAKIVELADRLRGPTDMIGGQLPIEYPSISPKIIRVPDEFREAQLVAREIMRLSEEEEISLKHIAILVREGKPDLLLRKLDSKQIPYWLPGQDRFESLPHVQKLIILLEAIEDPEDEFIQANLFERIILGPANSWSLIAEHLEKETCINDALEATLNDARSSDANKMHEIMEVRKYLAQIDEETNLSETVSKVFANIIEPRFTLRERQKQEEIIGDREILTQFANQYSTPGDLAIALRNGAIGNELEPEAVTVATLHYAKGREWQVVFLLDLTEGVLPHRKAEQRDEERRLLHVGVSRAIDKLYLLAPDRLDQRGSGPCKWLEKLKSATEHV